MDPEVPVTVMLKVPVVVAGVVVVPPEPPVAGPPDDPDGVGELPLPQPSNIAKASKSNSCVPRLQSLSPGFGTTINRNPNIGDNIASDALKVSEDEDAAFAVKVTTANPPANILAGSKLQVTFTGSPLQESVMPAWNAGLGLA